MRRTSFFLLVVAVSGLLASSCVGSSETGDPCRCPTLIEEASLIDWIGDGEPARELTSDKARQGSMDLHVDLTYDVTYSDEALVAIAERLIGAGYTPAEEIVLPLRDPILFEENEWMVLIAGGGTIEGESGDRIVVWVEIVKPDSRAGEVLAPLAEALGTIP